MIRPDVVTGKYLVYLPAERKTMNDLQHATDYAVETGEACIKALAEGCIYKMDVKIENLNFEDSSNGKVVFMERMVRIIADFDR